MKISIYELIGLIKDNKAPKKVKYNGATYEYDGEDYYLETSHDYGNFSLFDRLQNSNTIKGLLTLAVEILLEENDEWEDIEEKSEYQYSIIPSYFELKNALKVINENFEKHQKALKNIIKNQKYLKEKLENKDENN